MWRPCRRWPAACGPALSSRRRITVLLITPPRGSRGPLHALCLPVIAVASLSRLLVKVAEPVIDGPPSSEPSAPSRRADGDGFAPSKTGPARRRLRTSCPGDANRCPQAGAQANQDHVEDSSSG